MDDGQELRRVRWRSRRGMLELDLFLVPFAESRYADLTPADRAAFRRLLDRDDWEILDWLRQDCAPAPGLAGIVELVRAGCTRASLEKESARVSLAKTGSARASLEEKGTKTND